MSQHEAVFMAEVFSKAYVYRAKYNPWYSSYFDPNTEYEIREAEGEFIENRLVWSGEITKPHLKVGDKIFLHEYGECVEILTVTRSTDDSVIYQTDYKFELVEDENTEASKLQAEKNKKRREEELENEWNLDGTETAVKENWWQRLISNLKS